MFEWDEKKRLLNLDKHGLDFLDADLLYDGPRLQAAAKSVQGEARMLVTGRIVDLVVTAVITMRGDTIRLISLRRARDEEREQYETIFGQ